MAQTGYTPILIYSSSTAAQAPAAGNLTNSTLGSELAINITDGKLFYKDSGGSVQVIAWKVTPTTAGGTGLTSYTAGDLLYYATGTTLTKLAIGASTNILTSSGSAPQWTAPSTITVGKATNLDGGAAGSVPYQSGAGATTFLGIGAANTVLTSSGSAPQWSTALTLSGNIRANNISVPDTNWIGFGNYNTRISGTGGGAFYIVTNSITAVTAHASSGVSIGNNTDPGAGGLNVNDDGFFGGSTTNARVNIKAKSGNRAMHVQRSNGDAYFYTDNDNAVSTGANGADAVLFINKITSNSRSVNAAGTLNASGADYAEYMTKAGDFVFAKGDVCGVDADGKLTNVFANAVSFVVKSTDPSFVGGDTWGADLEGDELEAARQKVDRVAFAGQVPVNITGATSGQYIVPIDDSGAIKPSAVDEANMTLAMYMKAVGKVIAIEPDGRAKIIVKTA